MKKILIAVLLLTATLFVGCATAEVDDVEAYEYLVANIDDSSAIQSYLEKGKAHGNDIDAEIMGGDTVLMIAARYTTKIEVLEVIVSYFPSINQMNYKTDMTALDYLGRREGTDEMYKYLMDESVKAQVNKKVNEAKSNIVQGIFNRF